MSLGWTDSPVKEIAEKKRRLKALDKASDSIAQHQVAFAEKLNQCEEMLKTSQVNAENIERKKP